MRLLPLFLAALPLALVACGEDPVVPPAAPPEPTAAAAPAALTEPLPATPGTIVHAFDVKDIHCEGCAGTIRSQVSKLEGVQEISVSVPTHTVWVRVNELGPDAETLARTITDAGYEAKSAAMPG